MILSDVTLASLCKEKIPLVENITEWSIQPASIDVRIGPSILTIDKSIPYISMDSTLKQYVPKEISNDEIIIEPKEFILASTLEFINLPKDISAFVEGRSSIGRLGLFIHNAGWIDPGFRGEITLELFNATDKRIKIPVGRRIAQLVFCKMDNESAYGYTGKYNYQKGATGSRIERDNEAILERAKHLFF